MWLWPGSQPWPPGKITVSARAPTSFLAKPRDKKQSRNGSVNGFSLLEFHKDYLANHKLALLLDFQSRPWTC